MSSVQRLARVAVAACATVALVSAAPPPGATTDSHLVNPPPSAKPGGSVTIEFVLAEGDTTPFSSPVLQVVRHDDATGTDTPIPAPAFVPASATDSTWGVFNVQDIAPHPGHYTYTLAYPGDAQHPPTAQILHLTVAKAPALDRMSAPTTTVPRGTAFTMTGLIDPDAAITNEVVHVARYDAAHPSTPLQLPDAALHADGGFSVTDIPDVGGTVTYTFSYSGDDANLAATWSVPVRVSLATTTLTLHADAPTYAYGATATLTAQLGPTYTNRTVTVYAQPYTGGPSKVVASGIVDTNGQLRTNYRLTHNTVFWASFSGDYRTAPVNRTRLVFVWTYDVIREAVGGSFATSSGWHLLHTWTRSRLSATIAPAKPTETVRLLVQQYSSGAWHTIVDQDHVPLNSASAAAWTPPLSRASGTRYRFAVEANEYAENYDNTKTWGAWTYFRFV